MDEYMQARAVAKRLGIKTDTLKRWRRDGRGPRGWKKSGKTVVLYPVAEIEAWIRSLAGDVGGQKEASDGLGR